MSAVSEQFMQALHHLDEQRDPGPLVELTAEGAVLTKLGDHREATGPEGARGFWEEYRGVFDTISTEFTHTVDGAGSSCLEWTSTGTLPDGADLSYRGVTVIDVDGEQVTGVRTYYDSAAFVGPSGG
jgi:ketosteroid isomerase-like protein